MPTSNTPLGRVFLVEDDDLVAKFIQHALKSAGYEVELFQSAEAFLLRAMPDEASCLFADLVLPGSSGIALCREVVKRGYPCSLVIISGCGDIATSVEAMKLGAVDFLQKPCNSQQIRETVAQAMQVSHKNFAARHEEAKILKSLAALTPRETEILQGISEGLLSKEIAKKLGISHRTVDVHRSHILEKLGVESPTQLAHIMCVMERHQIRFDTVHPLPYPVTKNMVRSTAERASA